MLFLKPRILYSPDVEGGGASADAGKAGTDDATAKMLAEAFNNIATRQGGQDAAGVLLLQENKEYRAEIKGLKAELEQARGKVPADGSVILSAEDAAAWNAYKELGKPEEIKSMKDEYQGLQRDAVYREVAEAHGYKPAVLSQLPGVGELNFEVREIEKDGQKSKAAFVTNGDGQERPLSEYASEKWADFMPALAVEATSQQQTSFTPFPKQSTGGGQAKSDPVNDYLARKQKAAEGRKNLATGE